MQRKGYSWLLALCWGLAPFQGQGQGEGEEFKWTLRSAKAPGQPEVVPEGPPLPSIADSPVRFLARMLAASELERERMLRSHTAESQAFWLRKIGQYEIFSEAERQERLQISQLHWYLALLIRVPPEQRARRLLDIPRLDRHIVERRLKQWDELSEQLRDDILANIKVLQYFARLASQLPKERESLVEGSQDLAAAGKELSASWQQLPLERRREMFNAYVQFYQMPASRQEATLQKVPFPPVRRELQDRLTELDRLPQEERRQLIGSLKTFAQMTPEEQARFHRNAARWRTMAPQEREFWMRYVKGLPPLPPGVRSAGNP